MLLVAQELSTGPKVLSVPEIGPSKRVLLKVPGYLGA